MKRSAVFEGVLVTLLLLLVFLMLAMVAGGSAGAGYMDIGGLNDFPYTHAGQDNTLYLISGNAIRAIDSHGNRLWNYTTPDQWRICGRWEYSPEHSTTWYGQIDDGGPIVASDNGVLYAYIKPTSSYRAMSRSFLLEGSLIAISREGKVLWSRPLESLMAGSPSMLDRDGWAGDVSLTARSGRVYAFHHYNETAIDAENGATLWNVANVSDPGSVDDRGYVYLVRSGGSDIDDEDANAYRQNVKDFREPSGIVEAYDPNGTLYWREDLGMQLQRQFTVDRSLPLCQDGMIYAPTKNGVEALYNNGTVKWVKMFKPDEFKFGLLPWYNETYGDLSVYSIMPFDTEGNLYLQYASSFTVDEFGQDVVARSYRPLYLIAIGPEGRELSRTLMGDDTYQAARDGIGYNQTGSDKISVSSVNDLKNGTVHAYDMKNGMELWNYTFEITAPVIVTVDRYNVGMIFGSWVAGDILQNPDTPYNMITDIDPSQNFHSTIVTNAGVSVYPGNGMVYVRFQSIACEAPIILNRSRCAYYGGTYAFDEAGKLIWYKSTPPTAYPLQVTPGGTIFYTTNDGRLGITESGAAAGFTITAALYILIRFLCLGAVARARARMNKNENRNRILDFIVDNPGSTLYEISRGLGMNMGTIRYHTLILGLSHKVVASRMDGKYIRYFTNSGSYGRDEQLILSFLRRDAIGKVLRAIAANPGISIARIARDLGMPDSVAFRYARELVDKGIVEKAGDGREHTYAVNEKQRERVVLAMERTRPK